MTPESNLNRDRVHELRGLVNGLEFLSKRLAKSALEDDCSAFVSFADAVARYAIIAATYQQPLAPFAKQHAAQSVLTKNLNDIEELLRSIAASRGTELPVILPLVDQALGQLKILIAFFS